jgi:hypothetical protein
VPRSTTPRGYRLGPGGSPPQAKRRDPKVTEEVADPRVPRHWVDHSLQRRRTLSAAVLAATGSSDALDPHPDLLRAAQHHGQPADTTCPWCRGEALVLLRYVFSDELGPFSGRIKSEAELAEMSPDFGFLDVYVVEVCPDCHWNHLLHTYVLGDGQPRPPLRRPADLLD